MKIVNVTLVNFCEESLCNKTKAMFTRKCFSSAVSCIVLVINFFHSITVGPEQCVPTILGTYVCFVDIHRFNLLRTWLVVKWRHLVDTFPLMSFLVFHWSFFFLIALLKLDTNLSYLTAVSLFVNTDFYKLNR